MNPEFNSYLLQSHCAKADTLKELQHYCNHRFEKQSGDEFQIDEQPHIQAYGQYLKEAETRGAFETLRQHLVQLQFPIEAGISQTESYKNVVLRGKPRQDGPGLELISPNLIELQVYEDDLIGKVPVLVIASKEDFDTIFCALTNKNEPKAIPPSMGAAFIKGLNNWSRIHKLKNEWLANNPFGSWNQEFKQNILPHPELYQDQLILLSKNPYSNVSAATLNLDENEWQSYSIAIRRAHECAHLFTLRQYGKMENHVFDELIADYAGITSAIGKFELNWFLHFMGLERPDNYREGGRFQNYVPGLSKEASEVIQSLLLKAAENLASFDANLDEDSRAKHRRYIIQSICETGLLPLASENGTTLLLESFEGYTMHVA